MINDLFHTLLSGSTKYIVNGIQSQSNKLVFQNEMDKIVSLFYQYPELSDLKKQLSDSRKQVLYVERYPFSFVTKYRHYKTLAYDNALDLINSLERRFLTGGSSDYCLIKPGRNTYVS